jgi:hypothetical protein
MGFLCLLCRADRQAWAALEGTLRIQGRDIEPTHKRIVFDSDFLYWRIVGDAAAPEEKLPEKPGRSKGVGFSSPSAAARPGHRAAYDSPGL